MPSYGRHPEGRLTKLDTVSGSSEPGARRGIIAVVERITVKLIPKVQTELAQLRESTGMSITDLVNRAITLYHFVMSLSANEELLVRNNDDGSVKSIRLN